MEFNTQWDTSPVAYQHGGFLVQDPNPRPWFWQWAATNGIQVDFKTLPGKLATCQQWMPLSRHVTTFLDMELELFKHIMDHWSLQLVKTFLNLHSSPALSNPPTQRTALEASKHPVLSDSIPPALAFFRPFLNLLAKKAKEHMPFSRASTAASASSAWPIQPMGSLGRQARAASKMHRRAKAAARKSWSWPGELGHGSNTWWNGRWLQAEAWNLPTLVNHKLNDSNGQSYPIIYMPMYANSIFPRPLWPNHLSRMRFSFSCLYRVTSKPSPWK